MSLCVLVLCAVLFRPEPHRRGGLRILASMVKQRYLRCHVLHLCVDVQWMLP